MRIVRCHYCENKRGKHIVYKSRIFFFRAQCTGDVYKPEFFKLRHVQWSRLTSRRTIRQRFVYRVIPRLGMIWSCLKHTKNGCATLFFVVSPLFFPSRICVPFQIATLPRRLRSRGDFSSNISNFGLHPSTSDFSPPPQKKKRNIYIYIY